MRRNSRISAFLCGLAALLLVAGLGALAVHPDEARRIDELPGGTAGPSGLWMMTQVVSTESPDHSGSASLAVDAGGNVHVGWTDGTNYLGSGMDADIFYKRWDVTTRVWSPTEVVSTESTSDSTIPSLAVDAGGNVHVAWCDLTNYNGSGTDYHIFYKCKPSGGAWPAVTEVVSTESTSDATNPSLAVDAGGNVHIAWCDLTNYNGSGTDYDIFYKCKPSGGAWPATTEVVSTESTGNSQNPSLAVDASGNVHIAWDDYTNYTGSGTDADIFYKCKPSGGAWPATTEVVSTESTGDSFNPSLAVDASGYVNVAWDDSTAGIYPGIFYKCKPSGGAWPAATEVVSTESAVYSEHPSLAVDAGGNVHVAWQDNTNYTGSGWDYDIVYKCKSSSGVWPATTVVVSTGSLEDSLNPSLAVDAGGSVHVAWDEITGTHRNINYKVSPSVPAAPALNPVTPGTSKTGVVDVTWLPSDGAFWYLVYRAAQPIPWVVGLTPLSRVSGTSFVDTVTANGTWYYAVVAGNAYYNSTVSNCASVLVAIPPVPSVASTVPESIFYTVVGAMAGVAILSLIIGVLVGRRGAARPAKRSKHDDLPASTPAASSSKAP